MDTKEESAMELEAEKVEDVPSSTEGQSLDDDNLHTEQTTVHAEDHHAPEKEPSELASAETSIIESKSESDQPSVPNPVESSESHNNEVLEKMDVQTGEKKQSISIEIPPNDGGDSSTSEAGSQHLVPSTPAPVFIPSLRGTLVAEGNVVVYRGVWALTDEAHSIPGQTSDFEMKLVKPAADDLSYPVSGKYAGYFILKQQKGPSKHEDTVDLNFTLVEGSAEGDPKSYKVDGVGSNKFGKFSVNGALEATGMLQIYKTYELKPLPVASTVKVKKGTTPRPLERQNSATTPRESSVRMKKTAPAVSDSGSQAAVTAPPRVEMSRAQRLSQQILKCGELLKDIAKQPSAVWFLEPVDPIRLGIPDYFTIIKEPMDLKTVRSNLEKGIYESPESFAEHMRLIFKNAVTYNTMKDNPVHISARELSHKFEEKYRIMNSQLSSAGMLATSTKVESLPASAPPLSQKKTQATAVTKGKQSNGVSQAPAPVGRTKSLPGPRASDNQKPVAVAGSIDAIMEMQRKMQEMQDEIQRLRNAVTQTETRGGSRELTLQEKKSLISAINKLPASKMTKVIEIVRAVVPDQEEIEINELDNTTLMKLKEFVDSLKKPPGIPRGANSSGVQRQSSVGSTQGKRQKKDPAVAKASPVAEQASAGQPLSSPDELNQAYFAADSFLDVDLGLGSDSENEDLGVDGEVSRKRTRSNSVTDDVKQE